jgi:hypothetical protein
MQRVRDASAQSLQPFVVEAVETGSVVHTDGWEGIWITTWMSSHSGSIAARRDTTVSYSIVCSSRR